MCLIYLRMESQVRRPPFRRFTETMQLIEIAAEIHAVVERLQRPLSISIVFQLKTTVIVDFVAITFQTTVFIRRQIIVQR